MTTNFPDVLIGKSVVSGDATSGEMLLSDGTRLVFQKEANDCCSYFALSKLRTTPNVITAVTIDDDENEDGTGQYSAWVHVVTEAGELNIAEGDGDASNGYYLHGWALGVRVIPAVR